MAMGAPLALPPMRDGDTAPDAPRARPAIFISWGAVLKM